VFVSVKSSIPCTQIDVNSTVEIVWAHIHVDKNNDLIVGSFYCPPHSSDTIFDELQSSIDGIKQKYPHTQIVLGGDFNCPGIDWENSTLINSYVSCHFREKLIDLSHNNQLSQLVTFPTRAQNVLDLCFTTNPNSVTSCEPIPGLSDHDAVLITIKTPKHVIKQHPRTVYLYKLADWEKIREEIFNLSHDYFEINQVSPQSLDENWSFFLHNIQEIIKTNTPTKNLSTRTHLPWLSSDLKRLIRKKQRVYRRAKQYRRDSDWIEYKSLQKEVDHKLKYQHKSYLKNLTSLPSNNKKALWRYIKSRKQENIGTSALVNPINGEIMTDPVEKANALNQHFQSVFTSEDNSSIPIPDKGPSLFPSLPIFEITEEGVYNLLSNCDTSKSPGPDSLHPYALKATAAEISPIITHIFKQSLESGTVPSQWKHAYVTPIFKKGSKAHPGNYRPISLTSVVCKTMEHIMVSQIMKHLEDQNILSDNQFGFRSKHSCESQLLITINDIAKDIDRNLQVDAAILDFSKAFDRVAHSRLLYKLNYYGIRGNVLQWLKSFLCGRTQQVVVEGSSSSICQVTSGVPQGSVLGPVLFLIYINDIVTNIKSEIRLFADDILLYKTIATANDHRILQTDLESLTQWAKNWLMEFNIPKCNIIQFTTHHNKSTFTYEMSNSPLNTVLEHTYLGIRLHHKLSWEPHVNYTCGKANRLLGFMKRNLHNAPTQIKEYLYKQLLLPSIEYCSAIWDPYHQTLVSKLEMIQHRAARFVLNKPWYRSGQQHSVTDMLNHLQWPSLTSRRRNARLILFFKIVRNLLVLPSRCLPQPTLVSHTRTNNSLKFSHLQSRIDLYKYSFLPKTIIDWNNLKIQNIDTINLDTFKNIIQLS